MGVGNGSVPGLPTAPSERPSTRAPLVHIRLDFWVNYNPSATFGEDECCWQGAAVDFSAQSPAEPLGIARRLAPTGFVLHNKTRALVVERLWPSSPFVSFVERTDPDNNAFKQKNWVLISLDACMFFVCLLWKPDTILRLDAVRATRNNYFAICSSWARLSTLQTTNCKS